MKIFKNETLRFITKLVLLAIMSFLLATTFSCEKGTSIEFWEKYEEYYSGVEKSTLEGTEYLWKGIFTGTVREFTESDYFYTEGVYRFTLYKCNNFDSINGWCLEIDPSNEIIKIITIN